MQMKFTTNTRETKLSSSQNFASSDKLTDVVRKFGTAEKCHLSNLSNTPQNFCPMMVLTIGHKMGQKNCPWWAPGLGNHFGLHII